MDFVYFAFVFCQVTVILGETALCCVLLTHVTHVSRELLNLFVADLISLKPPPTQLLHNHRHAYLYSLLRVFFSFTLTDPEADENWREECWGREGGVANFLQINANLNAAKSF